MIAVVKYVMSFIMMTKKQKWIMTVQNSNWDYHNDAFDYEEIEVNYCFECGIKLGGRIVDAKYMANQ